MVKQTEYGVWLSAQKIACDAQIERNNGKADRATLETESECSEVTTALQLRRDGAAAALQGKALSSDSEWADNSS